jgi:hypothetical protein
MLFTSYLAKIKGESIDGKSRTRTTTDNNLFYISR